MRVTVGSLTDGFPLLWLESLCMQIHLISMSPFHPLQKRNKSSSVLKFYQQCDAPSPPAFIHFLSLTQADVESFICLVMPPVLDPDEWSMRIHYCCRSWLQVFHSAYIIWFLPQSHDVFVPPSSGWESCEGHSVGGPAGGPQRVQQEAAQQHPQVDPVNPVVLEWG